MSHLTTGLVCPNCGSNNTTVILGYGYKGKQCKHCGFRDWPSDEKTIRRKSLPIRYTAWELVEIAAFFGWIICAFYWIVKIHISNTLYAMGVPLAAALGITALLLGNRSITRADAQRNARVPWKGTFIFGILLLICSALVLIGFYILSNIRL